MEATLPNPYAPVKAEAESGEKAEENKAEEIKTEEKAEPDTKGEEK